MGRGDTRTPEPFDAMSMNGATDSFSERRAAAMDRDIEVCRHFYRLLKPKSSVDRISKSEYYILLNTRLPYSISTNAAFKQ